MPLVPILAQMELTGIELDTKHLAQMSGELDEQLKRLEFEDLQARRPRV